MTKLNKETQKNLQALSKKFNKEVEQGQIKIKKEQAKLENLYKDFLEQEAIVQKLNDTVTQKKRAIQSFDSALYTLEKIEATIPQKKNSFKGSTTFYIDGSGSMIGYDGKQNNSKSPIICALEGFKDFSKKTKETKAFLWGSQTLQEINPDDLESSAHGLNCGTSFKPAVAHMIEMVQTSKKKAQNFFILSDGDLLDAKESFQKAIELLTAHKKTSLHFIIMASDKQIRQNEMNDFAEKLKAAFPIQVTSNIVKTGTPLNDIINKYSPQKKKSVQKKSTQKTQPKN